MTVHQLPAQLVVLPSSPNACLCTGGLNYTSPGNQSFSYNLMNGLGNLVGSGNAPGGTISLANLCPSVYSLQITLPGSVIVEYFNVTPGALNPGNAINISVCSTDGSVNLNNEITGILPGGTWTDPNLNAGLNMPLAAASMTDGWYTYVIPSGGCAAVTGVYVDFIQNADPGLTTTYEICETYAPFFMTDFMQGDPDPYGQWYDSNGNEIDGFFYPATMNSGLFTYVIDTVAGCSPVFRTMNIDENAQPTAGTDTQILVCENGVPFSMVAQLAGFPDLGGQWTGPGNVPVGNTFNPATYVEGIYRYTVTANAPCIADQSFLTIEFTTSNPSGDPTILAYCETAPNVNLFNALNGNPIAGGTWTNPAGQVFGGTFDPGVDPAGIYNYYYPNVGCSPAGANVTINIENLLSAGNNNSLSICDNVASINLNGQLSPGTSPGGIWTDAVGSIAGPTFFPPNTGNSFTFTYSVNGTLCPDDASLLTITLQPSPADIADIQIDLCSESAPIDLSSYYPTNPGVVFEFVNGAPASDIFDPSTATDMNLIAVLPSGNSCPDSEGIVSIDIGEPLFETDTVYANVCATSQTFDLSNLIASGLDADGSWYDAQNNPVSSVIPVNFTGTRTYRFELYTPATCGSSEFFGEITAYQMNEAGENTTASYCNTDDPVLLVSLMPSASSGIGIWSYNGLPYNSDQIDPAVNTTGSYVYIVPANGPCPSDAAELFVTIQQGLGYDAGNDVEVCEGSSAVQIGMSGVDSASYQWSPALNLSNDEIANPVLNFNSDISSIQTTQYIVNVDDGLCQLTDTIMVVVHPLPDVDLGADLEICYNESVLLSASGDGDYNWSPASVFEDNHASEQLITPLNSINIQLQVESDFGCESTDGIYIEVHPLPVLIFTPVPVASCSPLEILYYIDSTSSNVDQLTWNIPGIGTFNEDTLRTAISNTGIYDLEVVAFSEHGCTASLSFDQVMEVYPSPFVSFFSDPEELSTLDPIAQFINETSGAILYEWKFDALGYSDEESPIFEFPNSEPANFNVCLKAESINGCVDSTCRILHLDNEYILFVPNAFTPDNDGLNDIFLPVLKGFDESTYTLQIFDRWGEPVFTTNDVRQPWIGDVYGGDYYVKDDVYNWQIQVKDKEMAEYRVFRGSVTVIR